IRWLQTKHEFRQKEWFVFPIFAVAIGHRDLEPIDQRSTTVHQISPRKFKREMTIFTLTLDQTLLFEHADYPRDPAFGSYSEVPGNRLVRRPVTIRFDVTSNEIQNLALSPSLCVHQVHCNTVKMKSKA